MIKMFLLTVIHLIWTNSDLRSSERNAHSAGSKVSELQTTLLLNVHHGRDEGVVYG